MLEVCVDSLESAINAIHGGADEIEVCSSLAEGGLTPSIGLVKEVITCKPKINVMLRCRSGSDFIFNKTEMDTMLSDLQAMKTLEIDRFVFGALKQTGDIRHIHWDNCKIIVNRASPIPVTFHRAFDVVSDPIEAMDSLINLGFDRILTSGKQTSAADEKALSLINTLLEKAKSDIVIMPGAGITHKNARKFIQIGCKIVHSSCKKIITIPDNNEGLCMGSNESRCRIVTDVDEVRRIKKALST